MKNTKIYLVENCFGDPNKVYIGKTKKSREYFHKTKFGNQIEYTYIDEVDSLDYKDWEPLESYWIEQFRQWGFEIMNVRKKGGSGPEYCSLETREKLRVANSKPKPEGFGEKVTKRLLGHKQSVTTINKRVEKNKGKKRTLEQKEKIGKGHKGIIFSKERNKKIGDAQRGIPKPISQETIDKLKKPIIQLDLKGNIIKEWESVKDANKKLNISEGAIRHSLSNKNKRGGGFIWVFKEEWNKNDLNITYKFICQYTLDNKIVKEYSTIKEAASYFEGNISSISSNICSCLKNKQQTAYGYKWKYK